MSPAARWIIGIFSGVCSASFAGLALFPPEPGSNATVLWVMAAFCVVIVLACAGGRIGAVAGRLIGAGVCLAYILYFVFELRKPFPDLAHYRRSDDNVVNAVIGFLLFGVPGAYVALTGRFPSWTILGSGLQRRNGQSHEAGRDSVGPPT